MGNALTNLFIITIRKECLHFTTITGLIIATGYIIVVVIYNNFTHYLFKIPFALSKHLSWWGFLHDGVTKIFILKWSEPLADFQLGLVFHWL